MKTRDPLGDGISSVTLTQHVGDDKSVVNAARVSFGGDSDLPLSDKDEKLIRYLLKHEHGSPFEHNSITFKVKAPIFVIRQWMRHRVGVSYNEISYRYTEVEEEFYEPSTFRQQSKNNRQASVDDGVDNQEEADILWRHALQTSMNSYQKLLDLGVAREQARGVMPLTTYSEFYFTCNLRSLFHFLRLRNHPGAQWEIQQYAQAMKDLISDLFPVSIKAWEELN